ncbi:hypothetical protein B7494_g2009 [Chlorociboria aeruginascens]|nr:hypothetical protein B7494_g2009 [Chlorociboria aeruginascens]
MGCRAREPELAAIPQGALVNGPGNSGMVRQYGYLRIRQNRSIAEGFLSPRYSISLIPNKEVFQSRFLPGGEAHPPQLAETPITYLAMDRGTADNQSREGLLRSYQGETKLARGSFDNPDRKSEESQLDVIQFLDSDPFNDQARKPVLAYSVGRQVASIRRAFEQRSKILFIILAIVIGFWSVFIVGGFWLYKQSPSYGDSPPWYPTPAGGTVSQWSESYKKAAALVKQMTLPEKVNITTGTGWQMGLAVGNTGPATNVGFPGLALQDGPLGLRFADNATAFPAGITVGATWNKALMYKRGKAHGQEARLKGINALLGPCVGPLGRMPAGGRNWEGFGSDPYLQGIAAAETIKGIQGEGVMATIKHFVGNEQEHFRQSFEWGLPNAMSSNIDDRTLHELYGWPFADAIKAGVVSVMCSYQMLNNSYSCGNSKLLNGILKDELGFQGFVQSDWLAQRSGVASALAGLDMSMPGDGLKWAQGNSLWGPEMTKAVLNGSLPIQRLNDMVTRVVASWYQMGQDDKSKFDGEGPNFSSWTNDEMGVINAGSPDDKDIKVVNKFVDVQGIGDEAHSNLARQVATEGTVLVKNEDGILPLNKDGWPAGENHELVYRVGIFGEDAGEGKGPNACMDRGCNQGTLGSGWGSGAAEFPYLVSPVSALKNAFDKDKVYVTDFPTNSPPFKNMPAILKDQDVCIAFVNSDSGEGFIASDGIRGDRNDLFLQKDGEALVAAIATGCGGGKGSTIVVVHSVGPVVVERWINLPGVKGVIMANLPGQESGNAIMDILLGNVNPSGKLPYTCGKSLDDYGPGAKILYYPNGIVPQQNYTEGLYIDYRHFDKANIEPTFEFGFGLSYTTFEYSNLEIKSLIPKSALPSPRPSGVLPPQYDDFIPDPTTAVFPSGFRKLSKFIYPYISSVTDIKPGAYPYPDGYDTVQTPSAAGGGEGGNPDLWNVYATVSVDITNTGPVIGKEVAQLYVSYTDIEGEDKNVDFPVKLDSLVSFLTATHSNGLLPPPPDGSPDAHLRLPFQTLDENIPLSCDFLPITIETPITHQDLLSSSLNPTSQDSDDLLKIFQLELTPHFPFVIIPQGTVARNLEQERPFLYSAIILAASCYTPTTQKALARDFVKDLNIRLFEHGEKSLDLLQGLLVYLGWFEFYYHPKAESLSYNGRTGKLMLNLGFTTTFKQDNEEYESDTYLIYLVRQQQIVSRIIQAPSNEDIECTGKLPAPFGMHIKFFKAGIDRLHSSLSATLQENNMLHACLLATKSYFELLLTIPVAQYFVLPISLYSTMTHAMAILLELSLLEYDGWDLSYARQVVDFSTILDRLIASFDQAKNMVEGGILVEATDTFSRFSKKLRQIKAWSNLRLASRCLESSEPKDTNQEKMVTDTQFDVIDEEFWQGIIEDWHALE